MANKAMVYDSKKGLRMATFNDDSYMFLKETVGGFIEHVPVGSFDAKNIDMWCNDEGKLIGLDTTLALTYNGKIYDTVAGTIAFTKHDGEGGTVSLTDDDIKYIKKRFTDMIYWLDFRSGNMVPVLEY